MVSLLGDQPRTTSRQGRLRSRPKHKEVHDVARRTPVVRIVLSTAFVFALALVPAAFAGKGGGPTGSANSGCSISPSQVALDQVWTTSAWGLPNSTVNL